MLKTNSRIHGCWGLVKVHRRVAGDEESPCVDKPILLSSIIDPILTRVSDSDQTPSITHKPLLHAESEGIYETIGGQSIVPE